MRENYLIKVKSCNKLLLTLLLYNSISLTSVMGFKFLILGACHLATLYLHEKGCEVLWLLFETKGGPQAKKAGKQCSRIRNTEFFSFLRLRKHNFFNRSIDPDILMFL